MADMEDLFGSSSDGSSPQNNNDSSDNDNGSGDERSEQGDDDDDKRSQSSEGENEAAAGSGDEVNSNEEAEGSDDERGSEKETENVKEDSEREDAERDSENENEGKESEASGAESDQEQAEGSERSNAGSERSNAGSERSNAGSERSNAGSERSNAGSERSNAGSERSNAGSERSNAGSDNENEEQQNESGGESDGEKERDEDEEMASGKESEQENSDKEQQSENEEEQAANSDHENEDTEKNAIAEDLFGDADDISSGSEAGDKPDLDPTKIADGEEEEEEEENPEPEEGETQKEDRQSDADNEDDHERNEHPTGDNEEEVPEEEPPPEETRIDVEIPKINTDLGKEIHFVKLPNFISVETRPFDHNTYEDEIDDDEVLDEEGRARLKLKVENTVRWRWGVDEDANPIKESNAKFIKWSDGSMSLHLGSEIFDVHKQLLQGDHNHLFIRQGTGLQGQAVFRTKLTFRPHSTDSFTHRKITMSVADRSQKTQKIRILPNVGKDPEAHRSEMIKKEEDRLKASIRRESKQRRMKERVLSRGLNASYLEGDRYDDEEEDEDGAISLAAIKNKFKKGGALREPIYSSDSEGSEIDERRARRLEKAKAISDSDADGSEEDVGPKKKMARIEESDDD